MKAALPALALLLVPLGAAAQSPATSPTPAAASAATTAPAAAASLKLLAPADGFRVGQPQTVVIALLDAAGTLAVDDDTTPPKVSARGAKR